MAKSDALLVSPRLSLRAGAGVGTLVALGAAALLFLSTSRPEAPARPSATPSQAESVVASAARQLQAEGAVQIDAGTRRVSVSAEGARLVYTMRLSAEAGAAEIAAIRAKDAATLCAGVDPSRLIALGAIIEHRYADGRGNRFSSVVASCPGGGAAARAAMPVAL
jgi:hypothetical protein